MTVIEMIEAVRMGVDKTSAFETAAFETQTTIPRCPECEAVLKPDVVFFGEPIPVEAMHEAFRMARETDLVLVVGTSAVVYPASSIPSMAKENGAKVVEINLEATPLTGSVSDYLIRGSAGEILPVVVERVRDMMEKHDAD